MAPKTVPQNCPQCGTPASSAQTPDGLAFCGGCGQQLIFCRTCGAANLAWSGFCHNCGVPRTAPLEPSVTIQTKSYSTDQLASSVPAEPVKERVEDIDSFRSQESKARTELPIERMRLCPSCKKTIDENEPFCSYCGAKQMMVAAQEPQASLDPHTMRVALTMLDRIKEAKAHPDEYSIIDEDGTEIAEVALGKEKPYDARELSFRDQLRLLFYVFEYTRDRVSYKGEAFGEYVRWAWETVKTGGDCDCKVVLLATMLDSLAFRRMHLLILPPGKYLDTKESGEKTMLGHVMLEVELHDKSRLIRLKLDPSCPDCDVDEIPESLEPFLQNFYRIPIIF